MNTAFLNASRETYLLVRVNDDTQDYLTMNTGIIDVTTLEKESPQVDALIAAKPESQNLVNNARLLMQSVLPKTPRALAVLSLIIANKDSGRHDFVTEADQVLEIATKQQAKTSKRTKARKEGNTKAIRNQEGVFTLADLARELKLDPRDVRAKFRKANMVKPEGGWVFPNDKRAEITALVQGKKEKAPKATPAPVDPAPKKKAKKVPAPVTTKATVKKDTIKKTPGVTKKAAQADDVKATKATKAKKTVVKVNLKAAA